MDETHIRSPKDKPRTSEITDSGSWFPGSPLDLDDPKQPLKWHLIAKVLARLPADSMGKLHKTLGSLTKLGVAGGSCGIPIGTACSGSECPMFVLNDLMMLFQGCKFHHCFSCENVAEKRRWITTMFPVEKVFASVNHLGKQKALNMRLIPATLSLVDPVFFLLAGFSCKSISPLNPRRKDFAACA